jgi:NADPH2:quinone reductase
VTAVSASAERGQRLRELGAISVVTDVESAIPPFEIGIDLVGGSTTRAV